MYYYRAQAEEYKRIFEDPQKLEKTLLDVAGSTAAFQKFFSKHSELAGLFQLPGNDDISAAVLNEMQTRDMLLEQLQGRLGTGGPNAQQYVSSNIASAQSALQPLKDKLQQLGTKGGDADMPNFKPNDQKKKSFLQRIEWGTNMQSAKSNSFFPTTTDLDVSIGYKLNSTAVAGVGASYKMGWGRDFRHIDLSHQGLGVRSFVDIKMKGSFYCSGAWNTIIKSLSIPLPRLRTWTAGSRAD